MHTHVMMGGGGGGYVIPLFEMSLTHDCTTSHFDAAARPSPPPLPFR